MKKLLIFAILATITIGCTKVEYVPVYIPVTVTPAVPVMTPIATEIPVIPTALIPTAQPTATRRPTARPTEGAEPKEILLKFGECYKSPKGFEFCNNSIGKILNVTVKRDGKTTDLRIGYMGLPMEYEGYTLQYIVIGLKITPPAR